MEWFTGDLHFRHSNIVKHSLRTTFMSEEEKAVVTGGNKVEIVRLRISRETTDRMNDGLTDSINACVQRNDRLWILGDFAFPKRGQSPEEIRKVYAFYRGRFNCRNVVLIWGNHDPKPDTKARELVAPVFSKTYDKLTTVVEGQLMHFNHEPGAIWDRRHHGAWNIYGHCHSMAEAWLDQIMPGRFGIDVGVDHAFRLFGEYRPFSFDDIKKRMDERPGFGLLKSSDYHHRR